MTRTIGGHRAAVGSRLALNGEVSRRRSGSALFLVLFFMGAVGTMALSAIYLTGNANLMAKSYNKESQLKYAAEAGLALGKARLNYDPGVMPNTSYVKLVNNVTLLNADNTPINGITVNVWAGPTGSTTGQYGRFASVVAQAVDAQGTGFVRRLELLQESFAKYAYWSNSETSGGSTIYFANGDALWGPVWSNDVLSINNSLPAPTNAYFYSTVATAKTISGPSYATFTKGYQINQTPINLPSTSVLGTLSGLASSAGYSFTPPTTGDQTTVLQRLEFVAVDINGDGDSTDANDGFFRVYTANSGQVNWLRANWPSTLSFTTGNPAPLMTCGDWWYVPGMTDKKFFPAAVHPTSWFRQLIYSDSVANHLTLPQAKAESSATWMTIMQESNAECFPGGDPHLVAIARHNAGAYSTVAAGYTAATANKGGDDTTFTPTDPYGSWKVYSTTPNAAVSAVREDANYLYPLYRGYNANTKGVIYFNGTVAVSGVNGGQVTVYSPYTIVLIGNLTYAVNPVLGTCTDILGLISGANTVVADNSLLTPQQVTSGGVMRDLNATSSFYLNSVVMALGTSFTVENYSTGPTNAVTCGSVTNGHGCIYLTGGLIQSNRGPVGTSSGSGYAKQYSYDPCAAENPPPYFPTTGIFTNNKYYELDPVGFNVATLFANLVPK
jgi:hypothetical protein